MVKLLGGGICHAKKIASMLVDNLHTIIVQLSSLQGPCLGETRGEFFMSQCATCGASLRPGMGRCLKCGTSFVMTAPAVQPQPAQYVQPQYGPPQYTLPPPQYTPPQPQVVYVQNPNQQPILRCDKSKITAGLLAMLLGGLGFHKFYLGKTGQGILYLLFCWTYIPGIVGFFEGIGYLVSSEDSFRQKYGRWER